MHMGRPLVLSCLTEVFKSASCTVSGAPLYRIERSRRFENGIEESAAEPLHARSCLQTDIVGARLFSSQ